MEFHRPWGTLGQKLLFLLALNSVPGSLQGFLGRLQPGPCTADPLRSTGLDANEVTTELPGGLRGESSWEAEACRSQPPRDAARAAQGLVSEDNCTQT